MGRVEVKNDKEQWGLICDDEWDDMDASVFCDCLGYEGLVFSQNYQSVHFAQESCKTCIFDLLIYLGKAPVK